MVRCTDDPSVLWFFFLLVLNLYWACVEYLPVHFCCSCSLSFCTRGLCWPQSALQSVSWVDSLTSHKESLDHTPSRGWCSSWRCLSSSEKVREVSTTLSAIQAEDPACYIPGTLSIWEFQEVWELPNSWALQKQMADRWLQRLIHPLTLRLGRSNSSALLSRWDQLQTMESGTFVAWLPHCHHGSIISCISIWPLNSPNCLPRLFYFTAMAS